MAHLSGATRSARVAESVNAILVPVWLGGGYNGREKGKTSNALLYFRGTAKRNRGTAQRERSAKTSPLGKSAEQKIKERACFCGKKTLL